MTVTDLNALDRDGFVGAVGWVFEHSPWVAERSWVARPFLSVDALHATMVDAMLAASRDEQLTLLRAHPDLGSRWQMSDASTGEQASAGLNQLTTADLERLQQLTAEYRLKFGFPFLFAVKGSTPAHVLAALEERLSRDPQTEFEEGLRQVARIARFRLEDSLA